MATQTWESCIYSAEEERDFLKNYLGPTMKREGLGDKKIIAWDHNRDLIYQRASTILADPKAAQYVWGIGFHWYEPWSGGEQMFDNVRLVHETFPNKNLIFTEGTVDSFKADDIDSWRLGEQYGRSMINDFNDGAVGWTDWNVLLDENGGPNHVGNFCFAPVHADTKTGELIYTNSYYYIGHFSKFVRPGARRIASSPSRSALLSTAFINPDGKVSVVVMNKSDQAGFRIISGWTATRRKSAACRTRFRRSCSDADSFVGGFHSVARTGNKRLLIMASRFRVRAIDRTGDRSTPRHVRSRAGTPSTPTWSRRPTATCAARA